MSVRFVLSLSGLVLASCAGPQTAPLPAGRQNVPAGVRAMLTAYCDAIREKGLLAEFAFLDSSAGFYWVPPGYTSPIGFDSVAAAIRRNAATLRSVDNRFDTLVVTALSNSLATYSGRLTSTFTDVAGNSSTVRLVETGVVTRRTTGWKLLCGHTSIIQ